MTTTTTLDERLSALEQTVATIQRQLSTPALADNWLTKFTGSISDEAAFREAIQYGRAFRNEDRPVGNPDEQT